MKTLNTKDVERLQEAQRYLKGGLAEGDTVWFSYVNGSRSGMRRYYNVYMVVDKEILRITSYVSRLTGYNYHREKEALYVNGYGFSAVHDVTEALSLSLFGRFDALSYREL